MYVEYAMKKQLFISFCLSLLLFNLIWWTAAYNHAVCIESLCYFSLTYYILYKYAKPCTFGIPFVVVVILGRIILELPLRVIDFEGSIESLIRPIASIVGILLSMVYFREKRQWILVLSVMIWILMCTVIREAWTLAIMRGIV